MLAWPPSQAHTSGLRHSHELHDRTTRVTVGLHLQAEFVQIGVNFLRAGCVYSETFHNREAIVIFLLAIVFVYLFLVAQYESWSLPFAVIGAVPLAIFGALAGLWLVGLANNIYAQVGLVLLVGLSTKTAILIVEFAMQLRQSGLSAEEAANKAAVLRFRAVLMTALSFVLGVLPLVLASGAGAASRISLGITVLSGMLAATIFGTLLVPIFYKSARVYIARYGTPGF